MVDEQGPPHPPSGASLIRDNRLDWSLALAAVAIGVLVYLLGDRTNWSGGFGFDGRFYGELAKNFPAAVFGHGAVIPPGLGHYEGPTLTGIDSYYAFRLVPSGLVWIGLQILGLSPTNGHVVGLFAGLNALMFGLATFCWCRSAGLLGLGDRAKLLGAIALIMTFAVLKTGGYYPVLTDQVALGLGSLSLYLWLRGATVALTICIIAACFTWPFHLVVGSLLLLFPAPDDPRAALGGGEPSGRDLAARWRPSPFGAAVGALVGALAVIDLTAIQLGGHVSNEGTAQLPVFPLSVAIVGIYVFAVVAFLLPPGGPRQLLAIVRSIRVRRLVLTLAVIAVVLVAGSLIARRPGYAASSLLGDAFWSTTLDPGLFAVVLVSYFGLIVLAVLADLPRVAADAWRLGPAMAAIVGAALLGALTTQPREIVDVLPFLLLPGVLAVRRLYGLSNATIFVFLGLSLALSRVWLQIGNMSTDLTKLQQFPAQAYYMTLGAWTRPSMYAVQLAAIAAIAAIMSLVARTRRSGTANGGAR
jgi:hypothetical protein